MLRAIVCMAVITMWMGSTCSAGSSTQWYNMIFPNEPPGGFSFGTLPEYQDGYDGQLPMPVVSPGIYLYASKMNGPDWAGPTGFYAYDLESPIPNGGSKTWWDICLWSYNYTPSLGDRAGIVCTWGDPLNRPPAGYTGILRIDYVPAHLNWDGPYEFRIDLTKTSSVRLPCPITDDPFNLDNVTRMHLTVYTSVPEPSSLAAMAAALAGLGVLRRRR